MPIYVFQFYKLLRQYFKQIIHQRRLIISSEKKIMQFTIGVPFQLCIIFLITIGIFWSSYATGRFIAANSTLEAQSNTIRSVVTKQFSGMFSSLLSFSSLPKESTINLVNIDAMDELNENSAKMVVLEKQVSELKSANETIIERVRIKTGGQLDNLESIVRQTGLDPESIKKQTAKSQKIAKQVNGSGNTNENIDDAEGGPYIATEMPKISGDAVEMFDSLDDLQTLRQVVANLPLGVPIKNSEGHSRFGHRIDPFNGNIAFHSGLDLVAAADAPILSAADGTVVTAGREGSYGNMIDIDHGFGIVTRYGHLSEINVHKGDKVAKGDVIGVQGSTGRSTGAHLHYEIRYNNEAIDPQNFLQTGKLLELGSGISQN